MTLPTPKNRAALVVASAGGGTGTLTLTATGIPTGYQSAAGADAVFDVVIESTDKTRWEVARGCTFTNSGLTLTRGTREDSSTGSAVDFQAGDVVYVTQTAERIRANQAGWLDHATASPTTGDVDGIVNTITFVDISGITAARNFILPASAAVGDRCGVYITATHATVGRELIIKANTGDTLNGVSAAEWSRVWQVGEFVLCRCTAANATWVVEEDGRIPMKAVLRLSTNASGESVNTFTYPTDKSGAWTADVNVGGVTDATTGKITFRRACKANVSVSGRSVSTFADGKYMNVGFEIDATTLAFAPPVWSAAAIAPYIGGVNFGYAFTAGQYIRYQYRTEEGSKGLLSSATLLTTHMSAVELLP